MSDYIKINRKILEWEWYKNLNTCRLFFHFLLKANWKDGRFEGKDIPRGSFVASIPSLSEETGLTQREVRTAISHLKKTGEVTSKNYNKYTVFTVKNYCMYQANDRQTTDKRHSNDILTTTIEKREEGKKNITVSDETVCRTDVRHIIEAWNKLDKYGIKPISKLTSGSQRYQRLIARIKQYGVESVLSAIKKVEISDFLQGKNWKGWAITFDWFVLPNNFPKILEGNYDNKTGGGKNGDIRRNSSENKRDAYADEFERMLNGESKE